MHYTKQDIDQMDKTTKIITMNSASGIKPGNLIGSISKSGITNLAIFSSVVHLGSDPALFGFILRPTGEVPRHTYENILETGYYTINHIHSSFVKNAHYTSAKLDKTDSEFNNCGLTEAYVTDYPAPFVAESNFKLGMKHKETIEIPLNGTKLVIGEVEHLIVPDDMDPSVNLDAMDSIGISGLNNYYKLHKIAEFPYVRTKDIPDFSKIKSL
ncbi:flavin reductase family protein [Aquimarina agarilytica]|uniref:flavin reductase family protein n=1 Tax=Aquimarina agarilytica TaxID=1087449 RepID=UPI0002881CF6|nr:flavin reductase [Aquimarina agarilytica]